MVETYTYIGGGEDAPQITNFMGRQEFVIGEETEVTDTVILGKIKTNQCFIKGAVERKKIIVAALPPG